MRTSNITLRGIFLYDPAVSVTFEAGDLIYEVSNGVTTVYHVDGDYNSDSGIRPADSSQCTPYSDWLADQSLDIVKENNILAYINNYIGGLDATGVVENRVLNTINDLNALTAQGIYHAKIAFLAPFDPVEFLIKVYELDLAAGTTPDSHGAQQYPSIVQEIIAISSAIPSGRALLPVPDSLGMMVRAYSNSTWTTIFTYVSEGQSSLLDSLNNYLTQYSAALSTVQDHYLKSDNNKVLAQDNGSLTYVTDKTSTTEYSLVDVLITNGTNQECIPIAIPIPPSGSHLTFSYTSPAFNGATITFDAYRTGTFLTLSVGGSYEIIYGIIHDA